MRKLICIFICMLVLIGCSTKKDDNPIVNKDGQSETIKDVQEQIQSKEKADYVVYTQYIGIKTEEGSWYYDYPAALNFIQRGKADIYANSDNWWVGFGLDLKEETNILEEAYEKGLYAFYSGMRAYFEPSEEGLILDKQEKINILGFDMYKVEGYINNIKHEEGNSTNCWVYGYTFILGNKPCSFMGMTFEDNSNEAKEQIVMYVDDMVNSLRPE